MEAWTNPPECCYELYRKEILAKGELAPRCYKTFPMLNSSEHEFYPAHKC